MRHDRINEVMAVAQISVMAIEKGAARSRRYCAGAVALPGALDVYRIGVVVPAYNEELLIKETIDGIPSYVDRIYVVDDCSVDRTPDIVKELTDPRIVSVRNDVNLGVGAAIVKGYKLAVKDGMDVVAVMAGDNQMDPEELPRLLMPVIEGQADYAKGNRLINKEYRKGMSGWRFFGNTLLSLITKIGSGYWYVSDPQNGYTAISGKALKALDLDSIYTYYGYCNDMLIRLNALGLDVLDVAIPARYGRETSSIKYGKYILKVAPMIFKGFLWRLKTKYLSRGLHPVAAFYGLGMALGLAGLIFCLLTAAGLGLGYIASPVLPLAFLAIFLGGTLSVMVAMLMEMVMS